VEYSRLLKKIKNNLKSLIPVNVFRVLLFIFLFLPATAFCGVTNLENMAKKNPRDIRLQFLLGKAYSQKGEHLKAKSVFQSILQQKKAPIVFLHLGLEFAAMGNLTGAILQWTSVIEKKPNSIPAMKFLARALHKHALNLQDPSDKTDLFEQSLGWWKRILHLNPGNLRARYYAGIECYQLGRFEAAAKHWLIVLRQKNRNLKVMKCLAKTLLKAGSIQKAKRVSLKILRVEKHKRKKKYSQWAQKLIQHIDNKDIEQPIVRNRVAKLSQEEIKPHVERQWKRPDPDDFIKPVKQRRKKPAPPPSIDIDPRFTIQAETLFLDGLDFKDEGQYEKALFAFLQAIDINPDFTQVFLQMGEVYIQLAKLAKRKSQFKERLSLARQALKKVQEKSPGSLIAHAAKSKIIILDKLKRYAFKGYHLKTAHKAIKENREDDAFDEYILILSNNIIETGLFLELSAIIPKLSISNKQDLLFFTEDLYKKNTNNPWITYLLGKLYEQIDDPLKAEKAYNLFIQNFNPHTNKDTFAIYIKFIDHPKISPVDSYLGARLLLKIKENETALKLLKKFLKKSSPADLFYKEAAQIEEQQKHLNRKKSVNNNYSFREQLKELVVNVKATRILFDNIHLNKSTLDRSLLKKIDIFLQTAPNNSLAVFIKAWINQVQSLKSSPTESDNFKKQSEALFYRLTTENVTDADWHFTMGIQALRWNLKEQGMAHLRLTGHILLSQSMVHSNEFADKLLIEAEYFELTDQNSLVPSLLRQAKVYSANSLSYYLTKTWIEARKGNFVAAAGQLMEWLTESLSNLWIRRLILCDIGLILFIATMISLFTTATALVIKYFEKLHHFFVEFISVKGIAITLGLGSMAAIFILSFSSGLIIFIPVLLWPLMNSGERISYLFLLTMLLIIPLLLPISFFDNFKLIKEIEALQAGNQQKTAAYFEELAKNNPDDYATLYSHGLLSLRRGELNSAEGIFTKLSKIHKDEKVLINLGVIQGRLGNYKKAISFFQNALGIEAKSVAALFNISAIHNFQGNKDKGEQYLRWAKKLATPESQLERFLSVPSSVQKLPLMDEGPDLEIFDANFSFFNSRNFFKLNKNLLGFIGWFLMGGGLVGLLLFIREQIDIISSHCSHCFTSTCNLCHHVAGSKTYCEDCADKLDTLKDNSEKQAKNTKTAKLREFAGKKAVFAGLFLPGSQLLFIDAPIMALMCQISFWTFLQAATGGWLLPYIFTSGPGSDTLSIFTLILWTGTLVSYLLPMVLVYRQKENIEWI